MSAEAAPRTARKRRARWAIVGLVAAVVVVAGLVAPMLMVRNAADKGSAVAMTTVKAGELVVTVSADGQTEPVETWEVYPEVAGTVDAVEVSVGRRVKAGATLFVIDDESLQNAVRQASAQLSQAKQQVSQADQQVAQANQQLSQAKLQLFQANNRLDDLESQPASRAATSAQIDEAKRGIAVAKAGVTSANAGITSAKASRTSARIARSNAARSYEDASGNLDKATITAPADGIVTAVNVAEGGSVSTGGSVGGSAATGAATGVASASSAPVVIADTSELIVTVAVNEVDIADVKVGQAATLTFDAVDGLDIPAKVTWVSPNAVKTGNIKTYDVELAMTAQDGRLRSGMTASADVVTLTVSDALLVPKMAVRVDGAKKYVTVVKSGGAQEKRVVTTGASDDMQVQVLTNLTAGEKIATTFAPTAPKGGNSLMPPRNAGAGMGGN